MPRYSMEHDRQLTLICVTKKKKKKTIDLLIPTVMILILGDMLVDTINMVATINMKALDTMLNTLLGDTTGCHHTSVRLKKEERQVASRSYKL